MYTLCLQVLLKYVWNRQIYTVLTKTAPVFTAHTARVTHGWPLANCLGLTENEWPQTLQIWIRWTITSGAPCWKSTVNFCRSLRRSANSELEVALQNIWKEVSLIQPVIDCHNPINYHYHQKGGGELHEELDCLRGCQWWSFRASAVTLFVSKSAKLCIFISSPTTGLFQCHPPTTGKTTLGPLRNGGVLVGTA